MAKDQDLTTMTSDQLHALLAGQRTKLAQLREDVSAKRLARPSDVRQARRDIARTLTVLRFMK